MTFSRPALKIYLSGPFAWRELIAHHAAELERAGYKITSRWLEQDHGTPEALAIEAAVDSMPPEAAYFADLDYEDVYEADVLIAFTAPPGLGPSRGGRHVEFGLAMAWYKRLIIVGPRENVFHRFSLAHGLMAQFDEWSLEQIDAALEQIRDDP